MIRSILFQIQVLSLKISINKCHQLWQKSSKVIKDRRKDRLSKICSNKLYWSCLTGQTSSLIMRWKMILLWKIFHSSRLSKDVFLPGRWAKMHCSNWRWMTTANWTMWKEWSLIQVLLVMQKDSQRRQKALLVMSGAAYERMTRKGNLYLLLLPSNADHWSIQRS